MIPVIYHPKSNITAFGLEHLHPFDGRKYRRIHDALIAGGLRKARDFTLPSPIGREELARVHTPEYLRSLRDSKVLAGILSVPLLARLPWRFVDWRVLLPMRYTAGGTLLAARLALEHGIAINLGGGYHHAALPGAMGPASTPISPSPWRPYMPKGASAKTLVIDLDAHQGNGTAATIHPWPWAFILDVFEEDLFPS